MNNTQRSVEDIAIELGRKVRIYNSFNDLEEYVLDILKSERREAEKLRQENEALRERVKYAINRLEVGLGKPMKEVSDDVRDALRTLQQAQEKK